MGLTSDALQKLYQELQSINAVEKMQARQSID